jgi:hypothetical protein
MQSNKNQGGAMHQVGGFRTFGLILLFCSISSVGLAQESGADMKKEIEELKQGQQAIQKDLMEIKSMLAKIAMPHTPPHYRKPITINRSLFNPALG